MTTEELVKNSMFKDNFIVDIKNCSQDKLYMTASIHNPNNDYAYSFNITTSPHTICYYGDVGSFIFRGISNTFALEYFRDCLDYRNYSHFIAPSEITEEFNSELAKETITNYFVDNWDIKEINLGCYNFSLLLEDYVSADSDGKWGNFNNSEEVITLFNSLMEYCDNDDEISIYNSMWKYFDLYDGGGGIQTKDWATQYVLCCENLHYYAGQILDKLRGKNI